METKVFLLIFEGLGTSELIMILIVALIIFGPRKLPELSRKFGKGLGDFKRASEDFKQTWEREVARESAIKDALLTDAMLPEDRSILGEPRSRSESVISHSESFSLETPSAATQDSTGADEPAMTEQTSDISPPTRKRDWL